MLTIWIDECTPCLRDTKTGSLLPTHVLRMKDAKALKNFSKRRGWYTNWIELAKYSEIYALVIKGTREVQGLIAVRPEQDMKLAFIDWECAAPHNNPQKVLEKKYEGVGGHLFAIAAQKTFDYGFEGAMGGFAANKELLRHYVDYFGAIHVPMLHPYQIYIPEGVGAHIKEVYNSEWIDEVW